LNRQTNTTYVKDLGLSLTAGGFCYTNEFRGFLPELMDNMYIDRKKAKKQMLAYEQEAENLKGVDDSKIPVIENHISRLDNLQMALKILLNSAYGAMANEYFRYFDPDLAESITMSGQLSVRWMANSFNEYFNKAFKTDGVDYIIAIDTDSNYIVLDRFVERFCKGMTEMQIHDMLQKFATEHLQKHVDKTYGELAEYMNAYENAMSMKLEVISPVAIWAGAKTYAMKILSSEGVLYKEPKYKIMGMSMIKSSTPVFCRTALKEITKVVLNSDEAELQDYVERFKVKFLKAEPEQIAFPRGVNNIAKYDVPNPSKTPIHVRAAIVYNKALRDLELTKSYPRIVEGDKIKFIYLLPRNRLLSDVVGFLDVLPELTISKVAEGFVVLIPTCAFVVDNTAKSAERAIIFFIFFCLCFLRVTKLNN
jgi:DNA polymerase elongation subunit (family B)